MVDTVTSQLLENGPRVWAYSFTNLSDGTGETGVVKVDGSAAGPLGVLVKGQTFYPLQHIKIREIRYDIKAMGLEIIWDATAPQNAVVLGGFGRINFDDIGGLAAFNGGVMIQGATGKILFTTLGAMQNSGYTVYMRGTKGSPQS